MNKLLYLVAVCVLGLGSSLYANDFDDANELFDKGKFYTAFKKYEKAAERGNTEAQYMAGYMLLHGIGTDDDYDDAQEWFEKAAAQGNSNAVIEVGNKYGEGNGLFVLVDNKKAMEEYEKAVKMGNPDGYVALGRMYQQGKGVAQDGVMYFNLLKKASESGSKTGKMKLAIEYASGEYTDKNMAQAEKLFKELYTDSLRYKIDVADLYASGDFFRKDYQIAIDLYIDAAKKKYPPAFQRLGEMFTYGQGVLINDAIAHACFNLFSAYTDGVSLELRNKDDDKDKNRNSREPYRVMKGRISDSQINEAIAMAENTDLLWQKIEKSRISK